jgi:phage protein D
MRTTDIQIKEIIYKWHNLEADINELRDETISWIETNHLTDVNYLLRCINELCDVFKVNRRI